MSDKLTIEIYGTDLPTAELTLAIRRFVRDTFDADWSVDAKSEGDLDDPA